MIRLSPAARVERALFHRSLRLPRALRSRMAPSRQNDRGTALDPDLAWLLWVEGWRPQPVAGGTAGDARAAMRQGAALVARRNPRPVSRREDLVLAGRPARLFAPAVAGAPVLLYLHGGGWVTGDLDTHEPLCRRLAADAGYVVVALDYRLAPEHPFPAGLDDAVAAFRELRRRARELGGDPERVAMGGDSAGGNLTAAACLVLRDAGEPMPWWQVLVYPATDARRELPSHALFADGLLLEEASIAWYMGQYGAPDPDDPRYSPLRAEALAGLPPAIVHTAGFDPLRDEGERYAERLRASGVDVVHLDAADLVHGFASLDGVIPAADRELSRLAGALIEARRARSGGPRTDG